MPDAAPKTVRKSARKADPKAEPTSAPPVAQAAVAADAAAERRAVSEHTPIRRVIMLVNPLSGSVGAQAVDEATALLAEYACDAQVVALEAGAFDQQIADALAEKPDVLFVLAGDGTARSVAARAGIDGPLIAPLPGGTMNMLPKALYGTTDWQAALRAALENGEPKAVAGGVVEGEAFYCAAILGSPALWAPAREAIRTGKLRQAWAYGRRALRRAFSGRIRYELDGQRARRTEALVLISPMISKAMDAPTGLEAAAMDPGSAADAFRLAAHALFDDWRQDPAVLTRPTKSVRVRARSRIPAVIDGEPKLLGLNAQVRFLPRAFMALTPRPAAAEDSV